MSLLSSLRRALTPKAAPVEPPGPMQLGGLQLECPVCSYDVFSRRRFGTLDPRGPATQQTVISLPAIACDRCGAVQLFDPTARSHPEAPIPPRRVARLQRRPEQEVDEPPEDVSLDEEEAPAEEEAWLPEPDPPPGDGLPDDWDGVPEATVVATAGEVTDVATRAGETPWPEVAPLVEEPAPLWPAALPPLPPLLPLPGGPPPGPGDPEDT